MAPSPSIAISATNPCHLYEMALELDRLGALARYDSGYPRWKLKPPAAFPLRSHSVRTVLVYAALRLIPERRRCSDRALFRWQDDGFDQAVARAVSGDRSLPDFLHAMPGQCLATFRAARARGIRCVLNHASGPVRRQLAAVRPEYERNGLSSDAFHGFDDAYFAREREEYALADYHCVASSVVREQLVAEGVEAARIWVVPYGVDASLFHPGPGPSENEFRVIFAGQVNLRKGFRVLLDALAAPEATAWKLDVYGRVSPEMDGILPRHPAACEVTWNGAVPRARLGQAFRGGSVLVLPSFEEAFGLVVPQALACGLPCIVSDRVGAKDLIRHRENGSIIPADDPAALRQELAYWAQNRRRVVGEVSWHEPALRLRSLSEAALAVDRRLP